MLLCKLDANVRKSIYFQYVIRKYIAQKKRNHLISLFLSGWQDSNLRPPAPKAGAIPGYATPRNLVSVFYLIKKSLSNSSKILSGWQDSNLRPPAPKAGAIPGYATPRNFHSGILFR